MKRIIAALLAALLLLTLLAGCSGSEEGYIGRDAAIELCLEHIGYTDAHKDALDNQKARLVDGASTPYYLVSFDFGLYMYEYKVNAKTGEIISWESEINPDYAY